MQVQFDPTATQNCLAQRADDICVQMFARTGTMDHAISLQQGFQIGFKSQAVFALQHGPQPIGQHPKTRGSVIVAAGPQHRRRAVQRRQIINRRGQRPVQNRRFQTPTL